MKVSIKKDKNRNIREIRCDCSRYLFTIINKEIFVHCTRCKRNHKVEIINN